MKYFIDHIENDRFRVNYDSIVDLFNAQKSQSDRDALHLQILASDGNKLINLTKVTTEEIYPYNIHSIYVTEYGIGYVQRKEDEKQTSKANFRYNLIVAVISGIAGAVLGAVSGWGLSMLTVFLQTSAA